MRLRIKIYNMLVNRVPAIQRKYHRLRQQKRGIRGRLTAWVALLFMNLTWLFGKRRFGREDYNPDEGKKIPADKSESSLSFREAPEKLAERLATYDVISFDVFDTLVLRPFACSTDLFFAVGEKLKYLDFERIRREMEGKARYKAYCENGSYEVTLSDIYDVMEEQTGIPKEAGMKAEIETELEMCFANPYMLQVFRHLKDSGKKIICTSDMYLPAAVIKRMVEKCGFAGISEYFISCEYRKAKGDGSLYAKVKETLGGDKTYVHIGDHPVSDVEKAKKNGFSAEFYRNVNIAGMPYRAEDMSIITGSMYRGIVNAHIHNGRKTYSREYELGFIYGGIFVLGYCRFIHEYVRTHEIDKILFLSRDGDILNQVYAMLYPQESGEGKTEYVYWSRLAAAKLSAGYFKYDYFRRFLDHKVNQDYTLEKIFAGMEIEDMLPKMCKTMPEFGECLMAQRADIKRDKTLCAQVRREAVMTKEAKLTDRNAWLVKEYLLANYKEVLAHYEEQSEAGKQYYGEALRGCKRVAAVDVGWAGSGAVTLNHIVNEIWHLDCEVIGILAGTNTVHNAEPNMSESLLHSGELVSYLFSQEQNRDVWKRHNLNKGDNLYLELLCSSPNASFKGFGFKENTRQIQFLFGKKEENESGIIRIQKGITDFVRLYQEKTGNLASSARISGRDAYGPFMAAGGENRKLLKKVYEKFEFEVNVG